MTSYLSYVLNADQWNVFVSVSFLSFLNWFLTFKNQERVLVTLFLTLWPYSSHSIEYQSNFVLEPTFAFGILIFSVVKNEWFQLFFRFSSFISFAIDFIQHTASLLASFFHYLLIFIAVFFPALVFTQTIFYLWIFFCCLYLFYDQFNFWISMKLCCQAYVQQGTSVCCFLS